ncbi:hypothetical protein BGZ60DRAFT_533691 [Tricladium varicosporioides]|nr:hypothetical protein BGZ60DRAFT_533691 [Hymenoscyphus varicosporioides]
MDASQPHDNNVARIITIGVVTTVIATLAVVLRLYTRLQIVRLIGVEDIVVVISLFLSIVTTTLVCMRTRYGYGHHIWDVDPSMETHIIHFKIFYSSIIVYNAALPAIKTAFILTYLRIFPLKRVRLSCYILLSVVICFGLWLFFGSVFSCNPIAKYWDPRIPGTCLDSYGLWLGNSIVNILTDFAIFLLPIPVIKSLNLAKKLKWSLMIVFAFGFFECIVSIIRLQALKQAAKPPDFTYGSEGAGTWSMIELNLGIFCVCLPTFRPLLAKYIPQLGPNFYTPPCPNIYITWQSVHDNGDRHEQLNDGTSTVNVSKGSGGTSTTQSAGQEEEDIGLVEGKRMKSVVSMGASTSEGSEHLDHPPPQAHTRGARGYIEPL